MAYAGGNETAGYAVMMAIVSVFAILLLRHRLALVYGIAASVALFVVHSMKNDSLGSSDYMNLSLQTFAILTVSLLGNMLARRLTNYESEAIESSYLISDMHQLNSNIINNMKRGLIVVSNRGNVLYINKIAWYHLGTPTSPVGQYLMHLSPELTKQLEQFKNSEIDGTLFRASKSNPRLLPKFSKLDNDDKVLITLEDYSKISKQICLLYTSDAADD